jgi:antitoxin component of MazEF toxin-antitoxin module
LTGLSRRELARPCPEPHLAEQGDSMTRTLTRIGEEFGLILDRSILDQLQIDGNTQLEVTIEDHGIVVRPKVPGVQERFVESARRMMEIHQDTFRKLAE